MCEVGVCLSLRLEGRVFLGGRVKRGCKKRLKIVLSFFLKKNFRFLHGSGKIFCLFLSFFENLGRKKKKIKIFRIFVFFFQDLSRSLRSLKNPGKKRKKKEKKRKKDEKDLENLFFLKKKIKKIFGILKNLFGKKKKKDFENLFFFFQRFLKISRFFMKFHGFFQDFSGFFQDFPRIFKSFLFFFFSQKSFFFFFFREKRIFFLEKKKKKKDLSRPVFLEVLLVFLVFVLKIVLSKKIFEGCTSYIAVTVLPFFFFFVVPTIA